MANRPNSGCRSTRRSRASPIGRKTIKLAERRWLAVHKPLGVVTTADDEQGRRTVFDLIPDHVGLTYVGRLDVATTGLLLLTTDGEAVHRLTHPKYRVPRRYIALVHGVATAELATRAAGQVKVDERPVIPTRVQVKPGRDGRSILEVTLAKAGTGSSGAGSRRWAPKLSDWRAYRTDRCGWAISSPAVASSHAGRRTWHLPGDWHDQRGRRMTFPVQEVTAEIRKRVVGQDTMVERLLIGLLDGRPRAARRRAGAGQDADGAHPRRRAACIVRAHPVHAGPAAGRRRRHA